MTGFKRVVAVVVGILAVVGVLLMLAAIVGAWIINDQVTDLGLMLLDRVEMAIDRVDLILGEVDDGLSRIEDRVLAVETAAMTMSGVLEENRIVANLISELLGVELGARVQRVGQAVGSIQSAAESIDSTLQAIDALPFVSLLDSRPRLEVFGSVAEGLAGLLADAAETRSSIDARRFEIIEGGVSIVTERTARMNGRIDNVQRALGELDAQLAALKARVQETKESFPKTLDLLTVLVNLVLLLVGFAFLSLFAHALSLFRRPEQSFSVLVGWSASDETAPDDKAPGSVDE